MNEMWNNPMMNTQPNNLFNTRNYNYTLPRYEVIKVNGEAGAKSFKMAPNSSALLADETGALIWLVQTDGAGYLTATPYDIFPHQELPPVNVDDLAQRVAKLEELLNAKQSNSQPVKQSKRQQQQQSSGTNTAV